VAWYAEEAVDIQTAELQSWDTDPILVLVQNDIMYTMEQILVQVQDCGMDTLGRVAAILVQDTGMDSPEQAASILARVQIAGSDSMEQYALVLVLVQTTGMAPLQQAAPILAAWVWTSDLLVCMLDLVHTPAPQPIHMCEYAQGLRFHWNLYGGSPRSVESMDHIHGLFLRDYLCMVPLFDWHHTRDSH